MSNYSLKYRTFDQLLNDSTVDMKSLSMENMIEPQQLIKVVMRCNYDLGLRIQQTRQATLELNRGKVKLPDDFFSLNFALMCGSYTVDYPAPAGTHIEDFTDSEQVPYYTIPTETNLCGNDPSPCQPISCVPAQPVSCCLNQCGDSYKLIGVLKYETRTYSFMHPVRLVDPKGANCKDCPNLFWQCEREIWIRDGFIFSNIDCGTLYINYQGLMEDEDGNLMAPDHPVLNEYYEYAVKERILENMYMNGEDVERRLMYVVQKLRPARNNALSLVNMPDFEEMRKVWSINRKAMYSKYYNMFASYPWAGGCDLSRWSNTIY